MIKVVLDTNVLVSALLNPQGPSGQILDLILSGEVYICLDERIRYEYRDVLTRAKFGFDAADIDDIFAFLEDDCLNVAAKPLALKFTDPADEKFLEVAVAAKAKYLITGNLKHYPHYLKTISIIPPAKFISEYKSL